MTESQPRGKTTLDAWGVGALDHRPVYELVKRGLDLALALAVLVLLSPLWLLIAALIGVTSPGPALFSALVIGRDSRPFTYYKFRTMYRDAEDAPHRRFIQNYVRRGVPYAVARKGSNEVPVYKLVGDPRVTPLGRLLRRFSLDEFPQLINVVGGQMSLVGPRPPLCYEYELYDDWAKQRLAVKPGITGLAQVRARGACSFKEMVEMDLEYIQKKSLWLDLKIILLTIPTVLVGRGYTG